jgi:hypothetical protein
MPSIKLDSGLFVGAMLNRNNVTIREGNVVGRRASVDNVLDIVRAVTKGCSNVTVVTEAAEVASIGKLQGHAITSEANVNLHVYIGFCALNTKAVEVLFWIFNQTVSL